MADFARITRARVDYDTAIDADIEESIQTRILDFKAPNLDVVCWHGGPCWSPYVIIEGESDKAVRALVAKIERYINGRKGAKVQA